ncbi:MAG: 16S rRNA (cytosine(1402)-N(4))-methyltransferase RsmH [Tissierellia bacterium]|nr:16S rRNA (cytosine(1402)-N(4))-methyltransferase RsmH [Tissierellia bacterium]
MNFSHQPVLLEETLELLHVDKDKIYIDGTVGGGGHSSEILKRLEGTGLLIGIDQDDEALKKSQNVLSLIDDNFKLFKSNYRDFEVILNSLNITKVDGILLDLGVSSHQFDEGKRGFSYRFDAPLDMRMDENASLSAYDIVNSYSERQLFEVIKNYGEEKWASRIAKFIVTRRKQQPIETTFHLVEVIKDAIPASARRKGPHPAKRTFQAIRIETNQELDVLRQSIGKFIQYLNPGGRLCIISFHSLEDRIVKEAFKYAFKECICPANSPICTCDKRREVNILTRKPVVASEAELRENNRAHSAKLRAVEKLEVEHS